VLEVAVVELPGRLVDGECSASGCDGRVAVEGIVERSIRVDLDVATSPVDILVGTDCTAFGGVVGQRINEVNCMNV
jgi:hypothetical protein